MLLASVLVKSVLAAPVLLLLELQALVLVAPLLPAKNNTNIASTSASRTGNGSTGAVSTGATSNALQAYIASGLVCYGISDISIGHSGTFFCVVCPKISTSQEKLAPTGLHGLHVFATLHDTVPVYSTLY